MTAMTGTNGLPIRCITIDVEEYFHIEAARTVVSRDDWNRMPSRVERSVDLLLEMFDRLECKATFFILGDVAKRSPGLVSRIASGQHEIACHGDNHDHLSRLNPKTFADDIRRAKATLEDQSGRAVIGYRAPTFSVTPRTAWAIDALIEAGFTYDSSIFPVRHPSYGVPEAPTRPFHIPGRDESKTLLELPPLTWRTMGQNVAVAGGGYFRLLPLAFMRRGLNQAAVEARPAILYFHPWEFDPDLPRLNLPLGRRVRTYTGLKQAAGKLEKILTMPGSWSTLQSQLDSFKSMADGSEHFPLKQCA